jgi:hypothetical protein
MMLYRFVTDWWLENGTTDGIEDLLIEGVNDRSMIGIIQEFHDATGGYDFKEFKRYLAIKGARIIDVEQVDIFFAEKRLQ